MKACVLVPSFEIVPRMRRVYWREKLPFPGANCPCANCCEAWMESLARQFDGKTP